MCLVVVAALERDIGKLSVRPAEQGDGAVEAHDPGDGLRRQSDLLPESCGEMPAAAAEPVADPPDRRLPVRLVEDAPRPGDLARGLACIRESRQEDRVEQREALFPARGVLELVGDAGQVRGSAASSGTTSFASSCIENPNSM